MSRTYPVNEKGGPVRSNAGTAMQARQTRGHVERLTSGRKHNPPPPPAPQPTPERAPRGGRAAELDAELDARWLAALREDSARRGLTQDQAEAFARHSLAGVAAIAEASRP